MADTVKHIDDGGAAFPVLKQNAFGSVEATIRGMTLRDWFAGQVLAGDFAAQNELTGEVMNDAKGEWMIERARMIYRMADAMIAARKGGAA